MQTKTNVILGVMLLLASLGFWWIGQERGDQTSSHVGSVAVEKLPLLQFDEAVVAEAPAYRILFVYGPLECQPSRPLMDAWHALAAANEEIVAENVLVERGVIPARRYLSVYETPYATRLDSTAYIQRSLEIARTPAVVVVSPDGSATAHSPRQIDQFAK